MRKMIKASYFLQTCPELLTRENFVCCDAMPLDGQAAHDRYIAAVNPGGKSSIQWLATAAPEAWDMSELLNKAFDAMAGQPNRRRRSDKIDPSVLVKLKNALTSQSIQKVPYQVLDVSPVLASKKSQPML